MSGRGKIVVNIAHGYDQLREVFNRERITPVTEDLRVRAKRRHESSVGHGSRELYGRWRETNCADCGGCTELVPAGKYWCRHQGFQGFNEV